jgi:hypothetical protein
MHTRPSPTNKDRLNLGVRFHSSSQGTDLTPTFHDGHALPSHIYAVLEHECQCPTIRETL